MLKENNRSELNREPLVSQVWWKDSTWDSN